MIEGMHIDTNLFCSVFFPVHCQLVKDADGEPQRRQEDFMTDSNSGRYINARSESCERTLGS
jgi:hypothetical protein